jgi:CheY-like chemotaxis protein
MMSETTHTHCLVVEDDALISHAFQMVLEDSGLTTVTPVESEEEALVFIAHGRPDIALLDVDILGGNSLGVVTALLAKDVPVAFIAGCEASSLPRPFSSLPFLQKPITRKDLLAMVARLAEAGQRDTV